MDWFWIPLQGLSLEHQVFYRHRPFIRLQRPIRAEVWLLISASPLTKAALTALSYTANSIFTVGITIGDLLPSVNGTVNSYSIFPTLPDGLVLDVNTGIISGTPTVPSPATTYTVTATNSGGSVTFDLVITVENVMATVTYGKLPVKVT
jgi:hypothetical protein